MWRAKILHFAPVLRVTRKRGNLYLLYKEYVRKGVSIG